MYAPHPAPRRHVSAATLEYERMRDRRVATWLDPESPPSLLREATLLVLAAAARARAARAAMDEAVAAISRLPATGRTANAADDGARAGAVAALLVEVCADHVQAIPEATLSATGMAAVLRCVADVEGRVLGAATAAGVDSEDVAGMAAAIHQVLPPNLAKHTVENAAKAAALANPPPFLAMYKEASRPTTVHLAAALEYIVYELLWMCLRLQGRAVGC